MGGHRHGCARRDEVLEDGRGERGALVRVGPGCDLVEQHHRARARRRHVAREAGGMRAEGGERSGEGLLVSDVREDGIEPSDA